MRGGTPQCTCTFPLLGQGWLELAEPRAHIFTPCLVCFSSKSPESLLREDTFYLQFNNRHRVQPVQHRYYRRKTYLCYQLEQCSGQGPLKGCLQNKVPHGFSEPDGEAARDFPSPVHHAHFEGPSFHFPLFLFCTHWGSVFLAGPGSCEAVTLHRSRFCPSRCPHSMFEHPPSLAFLLH